LEPTAKALAILGEGVLRQSVEVTPSSTLLAALNR
jgi:hypothetical protein